MPCYDSGQGSSSAVAGDADRRVRRLEAILCGLVTVLEKSGALDHLLTGFDQKEAGRSVQDLLLWWGEHKKQDADRQAFEAKRKTNG